MKYAKESVKRKRNSRRRRPRLLPTAILMLVLLASTACRTPCQTATGSEAYRVILYSMVGDLPSFPDWPDVEWTFRDGLYCLTEDDADRILDYAENALPLFLWELKQRERRLDIMLEGL
jgi:hypothetical protein